MHENVGNKQSKLEILKQGGKFELIGFTKTSWDETHAWNVALESCTLL